MYLFFQDNYNIFLMYNINIIQILLQKMLKIVFNVILHCKFF